MKHLLLPSAWLLAAASLAPALTSCGSPKTAFSADEPIVLQNKDGIAIKGYDPVAYFTDNAAVRGLPSLTAAFGGATYCFSNEANRNLFLGSPSHYAPAYGGWCAWALANGNGSLVPIDPRSFLVEDERLYLFYDGWEANTRRMWLKSIRPGDKGRADQNWSRMRGGR